jgi:hypothetical protein
VEPYRPNTGSQKTLLNTRRTSGLQVICANCGSIRDDLGHWHQVRLPVREHSVAECSCGICPECMQELYPEYVSERG